MKKERRRQLPVLFSKYKYLTAVCPFYYYYFRTMGSLEQINIFFVADLFYSTNHCACLLYAYERKNIEAFQDLTPVVKFIDNFCYLQLLPRG